MIHLSIASLQLTYILFNYITAMACIDVKQVKKLIAAADNLGFSEEILQAYIQKYNFRVRLRMNQYDILVSIAERINLRQRKKRPIRKHRFGNSQLKLFAWVVLLYCHTNHKLLPELDEEDYASISSKFKLVEFDRVIYQIISFYVPKNATTWTMPQVELFYSLVQQKQASEWKEIAYELFSLSNRKYFRFFEQLRQKWINYLNPKVKKGKWSAEEQIKLMTLILQHGHKWALISRQFQGVRNEHCIKNHYNKIVRSFLGAEHCHKKHCKTVDKQLLKLITKNYQIQKTKIKMMKKEEADVLVKEEDREGNELSSQKVNEWENCKDNLEQIKAKEENEDSNGYVFYHPVVPQLRQEADIVKKQDEEVSYEQYH